MEIEDKSDRGKEGTFQVVGIIGEKRDGFGNLSTYTSTNFSFGKQKTAIDTNLLTAAILSQDLYNFLAQEAKGCKIYITEKNRTETIGNLIGKGFSYDEAYKKLERAKIDLNLEILPLYPGSEVDATKLFNQAMDEFEINKVETFLSDCVILAILDKNKINNYYSNDKELEKICKKFLPDLNVKQIKSREEIKRSELKSIDQMYSHAGLFKNRFKKNKARR